MLPALLEILCGSDKFSTFSICFNAHHWLVNLEYSNVFQYPAMRKNIFLCFSINLTGMFYISSQLYLFRNILFINRIFYLLSCMLTVLQIKNLISTHFDIRLFTISWVKCTPSLVGTWFICCRFFSGTLIIFYDILQPLVIHPCISQNRTG